MFIAVTTEDEDNLVACQLAKHKFNVPSTIACVNNPQNELIFNKLGIDITVDVSRIVLEYIQREVATHSLMHLLLLPDRGMEIVEIKILLGSPVIGSRVGDIQLPSGTILSLIMGEEKEPMIPTVGTVIDTNDRIIALVDADKEEELLTILTGK